MLNSDLWNQIAHIKTPVIQNLIQKIIGMSSSRAMASSIMTPQSGGVHRPVVEEIQIMSGYFILLFLVLTSVYISRIPDSILRKFRSRWIQGLCLIAILFITNIYGWVHGILAALAFSLIVSHTMRSINEGLHDFIPSVYQTSTYTTLVPKNHRWFGESILGENPLLIRENPVNTSAVQDYSERTMGTHVSNVSR
jgi:hypothetical protein